MPIGVIYSSIVVQSAIHALRCTKELRPRLEPRSQTRDCHEPEQHNSSQNTQTYYKFFHKLCRKPSPGRLQPAPSVQFLGLPKSLHPYYIYQFIFPLRLYKLFDGFIKYLCMYAQIFDVHIIDNPKFHYLGIEIKMDMCSRSSVIVYTLLLFVNFMKYVITRLLLVVPFARYFFFRKKRVSVVSINFEFNK